MQQISACVCIVRSRRLSAGMNEVGLSSYRCDAAWSWRRAKDRLSRRLLCEDARSGEAANRMCLPGMCRLQSQRTRGRCHADVITVKFEGERRTMRAKLRMFEMVSVERFSRTMCFAGRCCRRYAFMTYASVWVQRDPQVFPPHTITRSPGAYSSRHLRRRARRPRGRRLRACSLIPSTAKIAIPWRGLLVLDSNKISNPRRAGCLHARTLSARSRIGVVTVLGGRSAAAPRHRRASGSSAAARRRQRRAASRCSASSSR